MVKLLIAEDDIGVRKGLEEMMREEGYEVVGVESGSQAVERIRDEDFELILTDLVIPEVNGMDLLTEVKRSKANTKVIIITAFGTIDNAVEAIKKGASGLWDKIQLCHTLTADISSMYRR